MKKLLLTAALAVAAFVGANAQTVYNISEIYSDVASGNLVATKGDFIICGSKKLKVTDDTKSSEGVVYTKRLQTAGKDDVKEGNIPSTAAFGFPVSGPGTVKFVVLTGSNTDLTREISWTHQDSEGNVTQGDTGLFPIATPSEKIDIDGKKYVDIPPMTWNWTGTAGTLYFYSKISGNNFYMISFTPATSTALNGIAADAEVVATEYYNINGMRVDAATPGIYVKKQVLADGSQKVSKAVVR
jgi:hypothetical protein